jgi:Holliday junction resolvase RusA-like endonuclease
MIDALKAIADFSATLPPAPSTNGLFGKTASGKTFKRKDYENWQTACGLLLLDKLKVAHEKQYFALILCDRTSKNADIDNKIKSTLDVVVKNKNVPDDRYCNVVFAAWLPMSKIGNTHVFVFYTHTHYLTALQLTLSASHFTQNDRPSRQLNLKTPTLTLKQPIRIHNAASYRPTV